MSAPVLSVYVTGSGVVNGDQLNTFEQTCDTLTQARAFTGTAGSEITIRSTDGSVSGGWGVFYWNATSTATDDSGLTTIQPSGASGAGRWLRLTGSIHTAAAYTVAGLPATPATGMYAYVTDGQAALAWGATALGGGAAKYLVWWNSTAWTVVGK